MTKQELIKRLEDCRDNPDAEIAHGDADDALIEYINDEEIKAAYKNVRKWYA